MQVIPVLDLKDSIVVLASGGQRDTYRPIDTPLCPDPSPQKVMTTLLSVFPFDIFYIADLDAIGGTGHNETQILELADSNRGSEFWIDAGFAALVDLAPYNDISNIRFVIGSESLHSSDSYAAMCQHQSLHRHILSLDRKDGLELGPPDLILRPELWAATVISMDLTRIGKGSGPNLDRILSLRANRTDLNIVAAGGVRGIEDLVMLANHNVGFALVATALHDQTLGAAELQRLSKL